MKLSTILYTLALVSFFGILILFVTNDHKYFGECNKAYYVANKEKISDQRKTYREAKKAAGYRYYKDPLTGKQGWVFVGLPVQEVAA